MNEKERKPEKRRLESKRKKTKNEKKKRRRIMEEWRMLTAVAVGRNHALPWKPQALVHVYLAFYDAVPIWYL